MKRTISSIIFCIILTFISCEIDTSSVKFTTSNPNEGSPLVSFVVKASENDSVEVDIYGYIEGDKIMINIPENIEIKKLFPTIEVSEGYASISASVPVDFSKKLSFYIVDTKGKIYNYELIVRRSSSDLLAIIEFSFLIEDNLANLTLADNYYSRIRDNIIEVSVLEGTDVTNLVPRIDYRGISLDPASGDAQNFFNPVPYTVYSASGSEKEYIVTVSVIKEEQKEINSFILKADDNPDNLDVDVIGKIINNKIYVTVPFGTDITDLVPDIEISGERVNPFSGIGQDFSEAVKYIVTAIDGTEKEYIVVVEIGPDTRKEITSFVFKSGVNNILLDLEGVFDKNVKQLIIVTVPYITDLKNLIPNIEYIGDSIFPKSGNVQDFNKVKKVKLKGKDGEEYEIEGFKYIVRAKDGSPKDYYVKVVKDESSRKEITLFDIEAGNVPGFNGTTEIIYKENGELDKEIITNSISANIMEKGFVIYAKLPYGTDLRLVKPRISIVGSSIEPGINESGMGDETDFSNGAVVYKVKDKNTTNPGIVSYSAVLKTAKTPVAIKSFSVVKYYADLTEETFSGNIVGSDVYFKVHSGTDVASLVPRIECNDKDIKSNIKIQIENLKGELEEYSNLSSKTYDFSSTVRFAVSVENEPARIYRVRFFPSSNDDKKITEFRFKAGDDDNSELEFDVIAAIDEENKYISATVPHGVDISSLKPIIGYEGQSIDPDSGEKEDFDSDVVYTVIDYKLGKVDYTVHVESELNSAKEITFFRFNASDNPGKLEDVKFAEGRIFSDEIKLIVPYGTDVTSLVPEIDISNDASVSPQNVVAQNFSDEIEGVLYTVTAEDGSARIYQVKVLTEEPSHDAALAGLEFSEGELSSKFDANENEYTLTVNYTIDSIKINPITSHDEAKVRVNGVDVDAGEFSQDFILKENNDLFIIDVIAEDFKTYKNYRVKIAYRQPGKNANLLGLEIRDENGVISLRDEFSKDVYSYRGMTYYESVKITALAEDRLAKVTINGVEIDGEGSVYIFGLPGKGAHTVAIRVTAEDGEHEKVYVVNLEKKDFKVHLPGDMTVYKYGNILKGVKNYNTNEIVYNNSVFVVWQSENDVSREKNIRGRFLDIRTGRNAGKDFLISTSTTGDQELYKIVQLRDRALVIWKLYKNDTIVIVGRMINLTTKTFLGNEFLISTTNSEVKDCDIKKIVQSGERVLVIWESKYTASDWDIYGRIIDFTSGPVANNDILISTTNAGSQIIDNIDNIDTIVQSGDKVLITWNSNKNAENAEKASIWGRLIKMTDESFTGKDFLISTLNSKFLRYEQIVKLNNRVFLVWSLRSSESGHDPMFNKYLEYRDIRGRIIDLTTGEFTPQNDFLISTTNDYSNDYLRDRVLIAGNYAVVMWNHLNYSHFADSTIPDLIVGFRIINLKTGEFITNDNFISKIIDKDVMEIIQSGDYVLFVWKSKNCDNDSTFCNEDIRGHLVNLKYRRVIKSDFSISTTPAAYQTDNPEYNLKVYMDVVQSGKNVLIIWNSLQSEEGSRSIHGRIIDLSEGPVNDQDFKINTTIDAISDVISSYYYPYPNTNPYHLQFVQSGNNALVIWGSLKIEEDKILYGRMIDLTKGPVNNEDFKINTTTNAIGQSKNGDHQYNMKIIQSGNKALVVWDSLDTEDGIEEDQSIYGRMIDMTEGPINDEDIRINTTINRKEKDNLQIIQSGNLAILTWEFKDDDNNWDIHGRVINLTTGEFTTDKDFFINTTKAVSWYNRGIVQSGDRVLMMWKSNENGSEYNLRGRMIDLRTGMFNTENDYLINSKYYQNHFQNRRQLALTGTKALVVQEKYEPADEQIPANFNINGIILNTGDKSIDKELRINTTVDNIQQIPQMAVSDTEAYIVWESYADGFNSKIRGRVISSESGDGKTTDDILLSTSESNGHYEPKVAASNNYGIVVWESDVSGSKFDIHGQVIIGNTGKAVGDDFPISTSNDDMQFKHNVTASGKYAFATWYSNHNKSKYVLQGRVLDITSGSGVGNDFLIHDEDIVTLTDVALAGHDNKEVFVVWQAGNETIGYELRANVLNIEDGKGGPVFTVSENYPTPLENFQVKVHESNAFIIMEYYNGFDADVMGAVIDVANVNIIAPDFILSSNTSGNQSMPQIQNYGNYVIATWDSNEDSEKYDIYARVFNIENGKPLGEDFIVNQVSDGDQVYPSLAVNETGLVVFIWDSLFEDDMSIFVNFINIIN